jgi:hypothetical protein
MSPTVDVSPVLPFSDFTLPSISDFTLPSIWMSSVSSILTMGLDAIDMGMAPRRATLLSMMRPMMNVGSSLSPLMRIVMPSSPGGLSTDASNL